VSVHPFRPFRERPAGSEAPEPRLPSPEDLALVEALRRGNESAFVSLIHAYQSSLVRLAMVGTPNRAAAERLVEETWLAVVQGIDHFAGCSLKMWIFRMLLQAVEARAEAEGRRVPFPPAPDERGPAVDPSRFLPEDHPRWPGHWASPPASWSGPSGGRLSEVETSPVVEQAVESLSPAQRQVITLRDVGGWSCEEVCELLHISEQDQRVLLHGARSAVRTALERYLEGSFVAV
jgi:RNA polymerase sigma-70 factor, ECF subfamily